MKLWYKSHLSLFFFMVVIIVTVGCSGGSAGNSKNPSPDSPYPPPVTLPSIPSPSGKTYYVSPNGSDLNNGSFDAPFATLSKAVSIMAAGDAVYLRGGIYTNEPSTIYLRANGTPSSRYYILAYPGEQPILDFNYRGKHGIHITGSYWVIKGLEIIHAASNGIRIGDVNAPGGGNYNIIEQCSFHHNRDTGLHIGLSKGTNINLDGSRAAYNWIINCDSYLNMDPNGSTGPGGNADGFACKLSPGKGNIFYGCRAWENSDDGWDFYMTRFPITVENCWTWHNGDPHSPYADTFTGTWAGNGQGFKVGGGSSSKANEFESYGAHVLRNCIAFNIKYGNSAVRAFDRNNHKSGVTMINCVAWGSSTGFYFKAAPNDGSHHTLVNCVAFDCDTIHALSNDTVSIHNSWNLPGIAANKDDFTGLDETLAKAPRGSNGELPEGFARLVADSDLIDKGVYTGAPFLGSAPDLGAFEKQ